MGGGGKSDSSPSQGYLTLLRIFYVMYSGSCIHSHTSEENSCLYEMCRENLRIL